MSRHYFRLPFFTLIFALIPLASYGFVVTVEPDDYVLGADLSDVSPYVTLQSAVGYQINSVVASLPGTLSTDMGPVPLTAPTGDLTFGRFGFGPTGSEVGPNGLAGLGLVFHEDVSHMTLLAKSGYPLGLSVQWAAFDDGGNQIASGQVGNGVPPGETFLIDLHIENMASIVLGGQAFTNAIDFDRLTFDVDGPTTSVPEPGILALFVIGIVGVVVTRNFVHP